jgi:hypothetical protein
MPGIAALNVDSFNLMVIGSSLHVFYRGAPGCESVTV